MATIKFSPQIEKATALHLVSLGKATPEQQKLAYQFMLERIEQEKHASERPIKKTTQRDRNVMIFLMLGYMQGVGEKKSQKQICREVAETSTASFGTIEREYRKWLNQTEPAKKKDIEAYTKKMIQVTNTLFSG